MKKAIVKKDLLYSFVAFISFLSTLTSVRYIRMIIPHTVLLALTALAIALVGATLLAMNNLNRSSVKFLPLMIFFIYLLCVTIIQKASLGVYCTQIGPSICACLLVLATKNKRELICIIDTWCICFMLMLALDLLSIIRHPAGLYKGDSAYYDINWFLGFKTERLYYLLPLIIMKTYKYMITNRPFDWKLFAVYALVLIDVIRSKGTSAAAAVLLYVICVPVMSLYATKRQNFLVKSITTLTSLLINYYMFLLIYALVFLTVVVLQANSAIIGIVAQITHKSMTFSGRMPIWKDCVAYLKRYIFFGVGMLDADQFMPITNGFINPHNVILSYLFAGGIFGLGMVLYIFYEVFGTIRRNKTNVALVFCIVAFMFVGIASSVLAFCPYFFAIIAIALKDIRTSNLQLSLNY